MEKLYSQIIGIPVMEYDSRHALTTVKDVVIDPESGKLVAVVVNSGKNLVITPVDILFWTDRIQIHNHDSIINANEVFRIKEIQEKKIFIPHACVFTENGKSLGKVVDFSIGNKDFLLKKLYVAKVFLGLFSYDNRIIPSKDIVEVLPDKIVVKNDLQGVKEKVRNEAEEFVAG
ncbi:MAG: PRC-barrel domain-containing protein [Candidatus Gracilibacteria bacterium]